MYYFVKYNEVLKRYYVCDSYTGKPVTLGFMSKEEADNSVYMRLQHSTNNEPH